MMAEILSIVGAVAGISGFFIALLDHRRSCVYSVHEYLTKVESEEFIKAKQYVYNHDQFEVTDEYAAIIVNFFHHWGMLAKRKYLPMWVFDGATGNGAYRLYEKVYPYIQDRQKLNSDPQYGEYFTWLYLELKKRRNTV